MPYNSKNIFSKILNREIPSYEIYRDTTCVAILDIMPQTKGHILIIPHEQSTDIFSLSKNTAQSIILIIQKIARVAKQVFHADGVIISQHNGIAAGQSIFHCHFHIIPCYQGIPLKRHNQEKIPHEILQKQVLLIKPFLD